MMTSDPQEHMLSPSSLLKITGVLARNGGEHGVTIIVESAVCRSWTRHFFSFMSGWEHFILFFTCLHGFGWSCFYLSSAHCLVIMTFDPLMSNTSKTTIVPPICSREVDLCLSTTLPLVHNFDSPQQFFLYLMSMMWESLWPTFDQVHFMSTPIHYPRSWNRDSLLVPWSLHASMVGSSCSTRGFHYWPPIEWFYGCSMPAHLFTRRRLYL